MFWWYYNGRRRWAFLTVCAQNAHRMRTECAQHIMAVRIRCACAPPLYSVRNAHSHCAQPFYAVRILCACSPTSVCMRTDTSCAHSVRIAHRRLWKFYPLSVRSAPTAHRCAPLVHPPCKCFFYDWFYSVNKQATINCLIAKSWVNTRILCSRMLIFRNSLETF